MHDSWLVRAVVAVEGRNAIGQVTTLAPGMRGWMPRELAVQSAVKGDVLMLSPGGLTELRAALTDAALAKGATVVASEEPEVPKSPAPVPRAPQKKA